MYLSRVISITALFQCKDDLLIGSLVFFVSHLQVRLLQQDKTFYPYKVKNGKTPL